ncbi:MAG: alpha-xylosidase, partial [Prevotella sp.]|nr:alpha-xylosidase [Prevotella sp.]
MKKIIVSIIAAMATMAVSAQIQTNAGVQYLQNCAKDMSTDFYDLSNTYFLADSLTEFDVHQATGKINWKRYRLSPRQAFNLNGYWPVRMQMLDFPDTQYDNDPNLRFDVQFIDERTVRVRLLTTPIVPQDESDSDPMFSDEFKQRLRASTSASANGWHYADKGGVISYSSACGSLEIQKYPWRLILKDKNGKVLTQTRALIDNDSTQVKLLPLSFIKRGADNSRSINPVFFLSPGEKIFGCGESFT